MHIQLMVRCLYSEGKLFPLTEFGAMRQASGGRGDGGGLDGRPEMLNRETVSGRDNHLMSCKVQTNFIKRLFAHTLAPSPCSFFHPWPIWYTHITGIHKARDGG